MTSNNPNILSDKKISTSSMISTSLNGPFNRPRGSVRMNDMSSTITKNEYYYSTSKEKIDPNICNEYNKLNQIYYNKKMQLNATNIEYQSVCDDYQKKYSNFREIRKKYDILRKKNQNLKLIIMNLMKVNNKVENK